MWDLEARLHAIDVVLVPDLGELVAGGAQFVDEASRRRVVTPLRCQGAEIGDEPGRGGIVCVRWRSRSSTLNRKLPAMASSTVGDGRGPRACSSFSY